MHEIHWKWFEDFIWQYEWRFWFGSILYRMLLNLNFEKPYTVYVRFLKNGTHFLYGFWRTVHGLCMVFEKKTIYAFNTVFGKYGETLGHIQNGRIHANFVSFVWVKKAHFIIFKHATWIFETKSCLWAQQQQQFIVNISQYN